MAVNLNNLLSKAESAYRNLTHFPEERAKREIQYYEKLLENDIAFLESQNVDTAEYQHKFIQLLSSYFASLGNTASTFITGGSGFNVRRNEKKRRSAERHYEVFNTWRERVRKSVVRKNKPIKTFLSELDRYVNELAFEEKNHKACIEANKKIRASRTSGEDITDFLKVVMGIEPHMIEWTLKWGFSTTSSLVRIKRLKERITLMKKKQDNATNIGSKDIRVDEQELTVVLNHEADRLQFIYDAKPSEETITKLKKNGFVWSPSFKAWQRKLTPNAIWAAKHFFNINI